MWSNILRASEAAEASDNLLSFLSSLWNGLLQTTGRTDTAGIQNRTRNCFRFSCGNRCHVSRQCSGAGARKKLIIIIFITVPFACGRILWISRVFGYFAVITLDNNVSLHSNSKCVPINCRESLQLIQILQPKKRNFPTDEIPCPSRNERNIAEQFASLNDKVPRYSGPWSPLKKGTKPHSQTSATIVFLFHFARCNIAAIYRGHSRPRGLQRLKDICSWEIINEGACRLSRNPKNRFKYKRKCSRPERITSTGR